MVREQFIEICKEVVISEEEKFHSLFNQMALSVDWTLEYQTINHLSRKISQMSFLDLVDKRLGAPLEILTTPQWFVRTIKHKDILMPRVNEIIGIPKI